MSRRVVVTGVGAVTPLGVGAESLYRHWRDERCGIHDGLGRCADFEPGEFLSPKEIRRADRFSQFAVAAADEAVAQAGWASTLPYDAERVGCVVGTGIGGMSTIEQQFRNYFAAGKKAVSPLTVPLMMPNAPAGLLAMRYGAGGLTYGTVSACAAGAHAIGSAFRAIQSGDADAVVAGGAEAGANSTSQAMFEKMGALSPTGESRPFDKRRNGFVLGEGAGIVVLEEEQAARRRGVPVLAEILGYGATSDAHHLTAPAPAGHGAARAITRALDDAGVQPIELAYVNAHGTSTPLNDRAETMAIKCALGECAYRVPVSSMKSAVGHMLGGAGAAELVATVLTLLHRMIPPTLGYEEPDDGLDLDYVPDGARALNGNGRGGDGRLVALTNSFGFGGHNAVLCIAGPR